MKRDIILYFSRVGGGAEGSLYSCPFMQRVYHLWNKYYQLFINFGSDRKKRNMLVYIATKKK